LTFVNWLLKADIALDSDDFIFRSLSFFKSKDTYRLCKINKSLSYTRARELLLEALTQAGLEKTKFELHSLRSGGVSNYFSHIATGQVSLLVLAITTV
jgi:hypothetical protein